MNKRRGVEAGKVYELCRFFVKPTPLPSDEPKPAVALDYDYEREMLSLASFGRWHESDWRKEEPLEEAARLFKGVIANIIKSVGGDLSVGKSEVSYLHPGMQASVKVGRSVVGYFGVVHPIIREALDLKEAVMYAECDVALLYKQLSRPQAPAVSDFPAVWRDVTLRVGSKEQAGRVVRFVKEMNLEALVKISIVDDFTKSAEEFRRVTYRMNFQRLDRTLRSDEVDGAMAALVEGLKVKHSIEVV
jgi:phenylalanyl-tRNA synthetase beta subunit